jgi:hypothetical protein
MGNQTGWLVVALAGVVSACGSPQEGDDSAAGEALGEQQQAIGAVDVGVIAFDGETCAAGTQISFYLDTQDRYPGDVISGRESGYTTSWVSRDTFWADAPYFPLAGSGFTMRFCRVDGTKFKRLSWENQSTVYAVLKVSSSCPEGAFTASRYMDNEDDDNQNSVSGAFSPTSIGRNANLVFCVFGNTLGGVGASMTSFPTFGSLKYAVFHDYDLSPQQTWVISKSFIYSNDEDEDNANSRNPSTGGVATALSQIIEGTTNTFIDYARVR